MRLNKILLIAGTLLLLTGAAQATSEPPNSSSLNVLLIICDDLNYLPLHVEGKPDIPTPHIDRLARRGVRFTNAHTNDPICAPSRASMMFGLYPQTSKLYWFEDWRKNKLLSSSVSLLSHFRAHGYRVFGTGKIYHNGHEEKQAYHAFGHTASFGPFPWDGRKPEQLLPHPAMSNLLAADDIPYQWEQTFGPLSQIPVWPARPDKDVPGYRGWRLWRKPFRYESEHQRDAMPDERYAAWAAQVLARDHERPFFLAVGFCRPHTPLYVPQTYFDRFPLASLTLPRIKPDDVQDCAPVLRDPQRYGFRRYRLLYEAGGEDLVRRWIQAYAACVSFVDDQIGTVLDALQSSAYADNTLVILTSDHGFHMGEKEFLYKQSLWDDATRIPLIISGPELAANDACHHPVSLIDLYPTLNDLCRLPAQPNDRGNRQPLDGHSLKPFLVDPATCQWKGPAYAITALPGEDHTRPYDRTQRPDPHFSIRGPRWRYTLCADGAEELYDHQTDPHEWTNLADDPNLIRKKAELRQTLIRLRDGH